MGYFSECAIDYAKAASYERVDYSYPTKQETLNYYLEDLTSALENWMKSVLTTRFIPNMTDISTPQGNTDTSRCCGQNGLRYKISLRPLRKYRSLLRAQVKKMLTWLTTTTLFPGRSRWWDSFIRLHSSQEYVLHMGAKTLWKRWNITILRYRAPPEFSENGIQLQTVLQI